MRRALVGSVAAALLWSAAPARAQRRDDGLYGRFEGDLTLRLHAGAAFAAGGPAFAAHASAIYLCTAGLYVHYTDALGADHPSVTRSLATGVHLAPLFLLRYASDAERGPAHLDLLLDSLAVELGASWDAPRGGPWAARPGLELAMELTVPILGRATGPYLGVRGALRWRDADFRWGAGGHDPIDRGALLSLTFGWHQVVRAHIVDPADRSTP